MKVLVINSGSSSIKYQLLDMPSEEEICEGMVERIGTSDALVHFKANGVDSETAMDIPNHKMGLQKIVGFLMDSVQGVIKDASEIAIVGHRVVHGGNFYGHATLIDATVKAKINELSALAPLHNPHNLEGIVLAEEVFPNAKQVAVFDTAFHQTMPVMAKKYAIPNKFFKIMGIQAYGFHGTSHQYVSRKAIDHLHNEAAKIISIHLGNGCSITAISAGKSIDHSLGFTPSNGLIMGSRSGDIDHSIIFYLVEKLGYGMEQVEAMLLKNSGMLGLTGYNDLRDIQAEAEKGNTDCQLALEMNAYRIKKYIGAYAAAMNGLDAIIFTAGVGENSALIRTMVCADMDYLGIALDNIRNIKSSQRFREINSISSKVKILVIPTNESLEIANQAYRLLAV